MARLFPTLPSRLAFSGGEPAELELLDRLERGLSGAYSLFHSVDWSRGAGANERHVEIDLVAVNLYPFEETVASGPSFQTAIEKIEPIIQSALKDKAYAEAIRAMLACGTLPPPVNDVRCRECSLKGICQPEALGESSRLRRQRADLFVPEE